MYILIYPVQSSCDWCCACFCTDTDFYINIAAYTNTYSCTENAS